MNKVKKTIQKSISRLLQHRSQIQDAFAYPSFYMYRYFYLNRGTQRV